MNRLALLMLLTTAVRADYYYRDCGEAGTATYSQCLARFDSIGPVTDVWSRPSPIDISQLGYVAGYDPAEWGYFPLAVSDDREWAAVGIFDQDGDGRLWTWHTGGYAATAVSTYNYTIDAVIDDGGRFWGRAYGCTVFVMEDCIWGSLLFDPATEQPLFDGAFMDFPQVDAINGRADLLVVGLADGGRYSLLTKDAGWSERVGHVPEPAEWVLVLTTVVLLIVGVVKARVDKSN